MTSSDMAELSPPSPNELRGDRPLVWIRNYRSALLRPDVLAGLTVTAIAVPESLGYAGIVGLPPQTGLYCALFPAIVFALMASSRRLVVGADSATAALVAAGAAAVVAPTAPDYPAAVATLVLISGLVLMAMSVSRLGFLADLIGRPVLIGFLSGVGISLIIAKLPEVLGIPATGTPLGRLGETITGLGGINWWSAGIGAVTVAVYLGLERVAPKMPAALITLVGVSVLAAAAGVSDHGVEPVGKVPAGLPHFQLPSLGWTEASRLVATGCAVALVVLAQSAAVARNFATAHGERDNTTTDLVALGAANMASALTGGFAINGSPPRSAAADEVGGQTPMVNLVMAVAIALILLLFTGLFEYLPSVVLDALVLAIGIRLIAVAELRRVFQVRRSEFAVAIIAMIVVAFVGVEQGLAVAVLIALADRLRRQYHPHDEVIVLDGVASRRLERRLGRLSGLEGVVAYRFGSSLFFENSDWFDTRLRNLLTQCTHPPRAVLLDASAIEDVDYTAGRMLKRLHDDLHDRQCDLIVAEGSPELWAALTNVGLGDLQRSHELDDVIMALRSN